MRKHVAQLRPGDRIALPLSLPQPVTVTDVALVRHPSFITPWYQVRTSEGGIHTFDTDEAVEVVPAGEAGG